MHSVPRILAAGLVRTSDAARPITWGLPPPPPLQVSISETSVRLGWDILSALYLSGTLATVLVSLAVESQKMPDRSRSWWDISFAAALVFTSFSGLIPADDLPTSAASPAHPQADIDEGARKAAQLQAEIDQLLENKDAVQASVKAKELLAWWRSQRGDKHGQTAAARRQVQTLELLVAKGEKGIAAYQEAEDAENTASALHEQGKFAEELRHLKKVLDLERELYGEKHANTARNHNNLAGCHAILGEYSAAKSHYQQALVICLEIFGEKNRRTALCYENVAHSLEALGNPSAAQPFFQQALDIRLELFGEKHPETSSSYSSLGSNLRNQGRYSEAQLLLQKAVDVDLDLFGERHQDTADNYNNLATNLFAQGKYAEAQVLLEKVLGLYRELCGEKDAATTSSYFNLAMNLQAQRQYAEAQPLFQQALDLRLELFGKSHPLTAGSYHALAANLLGLRKYAEAQPLFQEALVLRLMLHGERHPDVAASYNDMATNLAAQGKYAAAELLSQEAVDLLVELLGEQHAFTLTGYTNLACDLTAQAKYTEAVEWLVRAASSYEAARLTMSSQALDRSVIGEHSPCELLAAIHARLQAPVAAWEAAERNLARGLNDELASRRNATLTSEEQELRTEFSARLSQLQPRILELMSKQTPSAAESEELARLQTARREGENQLTRLAVALSQRELAPLAAVQAAIPADAALVMWVDAASRGGGVKEHWGCVVRPTGEPAWERLPGANTAAAWTADDSALPAELGAAVRSETATAAEIHDLAQALHRQRLAPLAPHLHGVKTLYVVAVNMMAGIPIDLLTDAYTISYVPSGTFLARSQDKSPPTGSTLLALGDPIFHRPDKPSNEPGLSPPGGLLITSMAPGGAAAAAQLQRGDVLLTYAGVQLVSPTQLATAIAEQSQTPEIPLTVWRDGVEFTRTVQGGDLGVVLEKDPAPQAFANRRQADAMLRALGGGAWDELPGTRVEVTQLARLFGDKCSVLLDSAASEQSLDELRRKGELSTYRYLHFATHGEANNVRAMESVLILSLDALPETPRLRAGEPVVNGQLSAREVLEFYSLQAELVTLSACDTALGRPGGGDGHLGFAQAFLAAGSRAVCLSLWKVDDSATALLMTRFYENMLGKRPGLAEPMPKAAALAEAKRWLRELSTDQVLQLTAAATDGVVRASRRKDRPMRPAVPATEQSATTVTQPFSHPRYWAAFILIGDPN